MKWLTNMLGGMLRRGVPLVLVRPGKRGSHGKANKQATAPMPFERHQVAKPDMIPKTK